MTYKEIKLSGNAKKLYGHRFGKLVAVKPIGRDKHNTIIWLCHCDCGGRSTPNTNSLRTGNSTSCGCMKRGNTKHGLAHHILYKPWHNMIQRCINPNHTSFYKYGGRGIKVCKEWNNFATFLSDMGERPEGCSLDRIDNNSDYKPNNCKWSTYSEQSRNGRHNAYLEWCGIRKCVVEWAEITGIHEQTIRSRKRLGWSDKKTLETPVRGYK